MHLDEGEPIAVLDRDELIRMNRLVRGKVDGAGFEKWAAELTRPQLHGFICALLSYAGQAGLDAPTMEEAITESWVPDPKVADRLRKFVAGYRDWTELSRWLEGLDVRSVNFAFLVSCHAFGVAERKVIEAEAQSGRPCSHWWHQL